MPCPVNLKQNITMGSKITNGLIDMKIHDMASANNMIGPSLRTRITSVNPPAQIITTAEAKVPKP